MIIGVTGLIGSGKSTVSDYIAKKYGFEVIDYSALIGEMLIKQGIEPNRENKRNLRREKGDSFVAEEAVKIISEKNNKKFILTSLRRPEDILIPKNKFSQMRLLIVQADEKTRFERVLLRERDKPKDWDNFIENDKTEAELFNFKETFKHADHVLENSSSREELYAKIDSLMDSLIVKV